MLQEEQELLGLKVGDKVWFETIIVTSPRAITTPRWSFSDQEAGSGQWQDAKVCEADPMFSEIKVHWVDTKGVPQYWTWPLPGSPRYAPGRKGWLTIHDPNQKTQSEKEWLNSLQVGSLVYFELHPNLKEPRWDFSRDRGSSGIFIGTSVTSIDPSFIVTGRIVLTTGSSTEWHWPRLGHPSCRLGCPGWLCKSPPNQDKKPVEIKKEQIRNPFWWPKKSKKYKDMVCTPELKKGILGFKKTVQTTSGFSLGKAILTEAKFSSDNLAYCIAREVVFETNMWPFQHEQLNEDHINWAEEADISEMTFHFKEKNVPNKSDN